VRSGTSGQLIGVRSFQVAIATFVLDNDKAMRKKAKTKIRLAPEDAMISPICEIR
jgi:hypothetical protein